MTTPDAATANDGFHASISELPQMEEGSCNDDDHSDDESESEDVSLSSSNHTKTIQEAAETNKFRKSIFLSKLLVLTVLLVSATAASVGTYKFTSNQEANEFEQQFINQADEIIKVSSSTASSSFSALQSFSNAVTSVSLVEQAEWPLVSVPHFEVRGRDYLEATRAQAIAIVPLVADQDRLQWESYSVDQGSSQPHIWKTGFRGDEDILREYSSGPFLPLSQIYPTDPSMVNFNLLSHSTLHFKELMQVAKATRKGVVCQVLDQDAPFGHSNRNATNSATDISPKSIVLQPIFQDFEEERTKVVAFLAVLLPWSVFLQEALSDGALPVISVLKSRCVEQPEEQAFTFHMDGQQVVFLGTGDLHNPEFDRLEAAATFFEDDHRHHLADHLADYCTYSLHVYPTNEMKDHFHTATPATMTMVVLLIFLFTSIVFVVYDTLVQHRNRKVVQDATATRRIIHNLFPRQVHDRLFNDSTDVSRDASSSQRRMRRRSTAKANILNFLSDESKTASEAGASNDDDSGNQNPTRSSKPIADLFPEATVMFCDIAGFTAWSSVREPSQVFTLLENVYNSFDGIAKRRKVFKVETIGDSYLAVAGLPTPRKDHATVMVRFASDCMTQFACLCQELETELGPGTSELDMRFGLHSGSVTAGVLRGEKTRFQLFGDTVNTASRMESTGERGKIQVSTATATLLNEAHKGHWCERRKEPVQAKGKGEMITYWVNPKTSVAGSQHSFASTSVLLAPQSPSEARPKDGAAVATADGSQAQTSITLGQERHPESAPAATLEEETKTSQYYPNKESVCPKLQRSISFISGVLLGLLREIVARRLAMGKRTIGQTQATRQARMAMQPEPGTLVLDEMEEIISLPKFDPKATRRFVDPETVELPTEVADQLHSFVTVVALMYQDNPFHSFNHATHVTMSVCKLLSRIVAPEDLEGDDNGGNSKRRAYESKLHDHTFGITSDPITQFAVIFSAMIHDVDHPGVPNSVLVDNNTAIAQHYRNQSVAEQNSLDVAWDLLMDDAYADLCACIFTNETELCRFRQLVVNTVLATDICDAQLNRMRKARWEKAFHKEDTEAAAAAKPGKPQFVSVTDDRNRKATIVIEHLIQASDVAHTMQHWEVYINWNEKLFEEMYTAYLNGHLEKDPSKRWYEGELGFFDFYIIPLAKKLGECGVFGVSSTEYLSYAIENRREWEVKGRQIVEGYVRKYRPSKECHFHDDLSGEEHHSSSSRRRRRSDQKMGACRDRDDATVTSSASTDSRRNPRAVDQLFSASYHQRSAVAPLE